MAHQSLGGRRMRRETIEIRRRAGSRGVTFMNLERPAESTADTQQGFAGTRRHVDRIALDDGEGVGFGERNRAAVVVVGVNGFAL
mgnify:CR=1 FL=1